MVDGPLAPRHGRPEVRLGGRRDGARRVHLHAGLVPPRVRVEMRPRPPRRSAWPRRACGLSSLALHRSAEARPEVEGAHQAQARLEASAGRARGRAGTRRWRRRSGRAARCRRERPPRAARSARRRPRSRWRPPRPCPIPARAGLAAPGRRGRGQQISGDRAAGAQQCCRHLAIDIQVLRGRKSRRLRTARREGRREPPDQLWRTQRTISGKVGRFPYIRMPTR